MERLSYVTLHMPRPNNRMELIQLMNVAVDVVEGMFEGRDRLGQHEVSDRFRRLFADEHSISFPFIYPNTPSRSIRLRLWTRCIATSMLILSTPNSLIQVENMSLAEEAPPPRRATRAQVNAIPSAPFREYEEYEIGQRTGERLTCSVCLTKFRSNSRVKKLQCHHIFHARCINEALQRCSMSCPMCRTDVNV